MVIYEFLNFKANCLSTSFPQLQMSQYFSPVIKAQQQMTHPKKETFECLKSTSLNVTCSGYRINVKKKWLSVG